MINIALSGATGFIGQALTRRLQQDTTTNLLKLSRDANATSINVAYIDNMHPDNLIKKLENFDCVIHLAARAHAKHATAKDFQRDNVELSKNLAQIARKAQVKQFIFLSSIKAQGNTTEPRRPFKITDTPTPTDAYGRSKLDSETSIKAMLAGSNTHYTVIRSPLVWGTHCKGNLKTLMNLIDKKIPIPFGAIHNRRDIISIENLCDFIQHAMLHPMARNQTFLVSDGIARSSKEIVALLASLSKQKSVVIRTPNFFFQLLKTIPILKPSVESFLSNLEIDISETTRLLNWTPQQ
jgi:nucleoside-diphosphate-sugar epimerase